VQRIFYETEKEKNINLKNLIAFKEAKNMLDIGIGLVV
jgi:hypothetical protein